MNIKQSLGWSFFAALVSKSISPFIYIVLARLLSPDDFGVMASGVMVIAFAQIFWEAGMGKALIQRQHDRQAAANVAFWVNMSLAVILSILLYFGAGYIAKTFFHDARVIAVLRVMTLQILFGAAASIQTALLQKEFEFKKLFWVKFATVGIPGLASIPLALYGMGYWALVVGTLVGSAAQVLILWRISEFRPSIKFNFSVAKDMISFSSWVAVTGFMIWFYQWTDALVIGKYLGISELGLFRAGNQFPMLIFGLLFAPITPVLYSHIVRMDKNAEKIRNASIKIIKTLTFLAIPISIMIFAYSELLGNIVFGEKWTGVGYILGVMALVHGYAWIVGMNGEIYRAMGKPSYETIMAGSTMGVYFIAYMISIQYGLELFLWTRLGLALFALGVHLFVLRKLLAISIMPIVKYILTLSILCGGVIWFAGYFLKLVFSNQEMADILSGILSIVIIFASLYYMERNGIIRELKRLISGKQ
jgi:O-antigen/teichoic acid export membrane protein